MNAQLRWLVVWICIGFFGVSRGSVPKKSTEVRTVCDVLEHARQLHKRIVTVRGRLHINWRHGVNFLEDLSSKNTCPGFTEERRAWSPEILLVWPEDGPADGPSSFEAKPGEIWKRLYYHVKGSEVGINVEAVIEGELRSRPGIVIYRREGARPLGNGYGRYGDFPAELVIKRIVKVEPPIKVY